MSIVMVGLRLMKRLHDLDRLRKRLDRRAVPALFRSKQALHAQARCEVELKVGLIGMGARQTLDDSPGLG